MQLTEELSKFAIAAQAKHAALADELGANTLFWRAGYGWVLYEEQKMVWMADVRDSVSVGRLKGNEKLSVKVTLTLGQADLDAVIDGEIELE